jgi:geranylgeranyl diphosphate synthase, type II
MDIINYLVQRQDIINEELARLMPKASVRLKRLYAAIAHALKGGKRIRPILAMASAEAVGAQCRTAIKPACAIEMLHAYSLVHDDLPCMDDDEFRRGRLTVHKKFSVAEAVLAGDALLTWSFSLLAEASRDANRNMEMVKVLSHAAGITGMIAGQAADIILSKRNPVIQEYIDIHKTGALIAASCKIGAIAGRATKQQSKALYSFGEHIGLAFQLTDDIIDNEATLNILGRKKTFEQAKEITETAKSKIKGHGIKTTRLNQIADFILNRKM